MTRKQKIIVSITGIVLVSLILVGLTYAYYKTRISGNTKDKSISVTSKKLEVTYTDGNGVIEGTGIEPGYTTTKTFTVENTGDETLSYSIKLDNITNTFTRTEDWTYVLKKGETEVSSGVLPTEDSYILDTINIDSRTTDSYSLTITYANPSDVDQSVDMGKSLSLRVNIDDFSNPYANNKDSLAYNVINNALLNKNETIFSATSLTTPGQSISSYKYKISDQTIKTGISVNALYQRTYWTYGTGYTINEITGKFALTGVSICKYNDGTCNTNLIGNYVISSDASGNSNTKNVAKDVTNLSNIYKVSSAPAMSSDNTEITIETEKITSSIYSTERTLSITNDDYGISYYYRGGVEDNYLNFAGMCWRIVRIEGNGAIKLILEDTNVECDNTLFSGNWSDGTKVYYGCDSNYNVDFLNSTGGLADMLQQFQTSKLANYLEKLQVNNWCYDDSSNSVDENFVGYGAYGRLVNNKKPSLVCIGQRLKKYRDGTDMYAGTLTADEVAFAGLTNNVGSEVNYLFGNYNESWYLLSPYYYSINYFSTVFYVKQNIYKEIITNDGGKSVAIRPSVTLAAGTQIVNGDGSISNPYKI